MSCSEIINLFVSIVSILIAAKALCQTNKQISLSNKQQLFDRRLSRFIEFNTIYSLYTDNKLYLKKADTFYGCNDLIFTWLTNCSDLEEMALVMSKPLHQEEQKIFLTKYEKLKASAVEISMIFDGETAEIGEAFVSAFADLLKAMYQQQVYISTLKEQKKKDGIPLKLENYEKNCTEMAESLGLFELCVKLETLDNRIIEKRIVENMKNSLRLTR